MGSMREILRGNLTIPSRWATGLKWFEADTRRAIGSILNPWAVRPAQELKKSW
jgi:hypothetical protein